ncbi:MAG: hypothetical protein WC859_10175 [Elusimicrobiota bacterium]|jgi:hypothetical protein
MKKKSPQERREARRFPIRVLVRCLPPGTPLKRNGHDVHGWEMWAKDLAADGVGLQWSRRWAFQRCPRCSAGLFPQKKKQEICLCRSPGQLRKGQIVQLDGLVYNEKGSKPMKGRIQWIRPGKTVYEVGIAITTPHHRSYFRALES